MPKGAANSLRKSMLMKWTCFVLGLGVGAVFPVLAELPEPRAVERGPHHTLWQNVEEITQATGDVTTQIRSYVELAAGLNYLSNGEWAEAREVIEVFPEGAVARQGQNQVIFSGNLNMAGAIDLLAMDGNRFKSRIYGLVYFDALSGQTVLLAELKDSVGQLVAPNQVLYPDAFTDLKADVRYTYRRGSFEQIGRAHV